MKYKPGNQFQLLNHPIPCYLKHGQFNREHKLQPTYYIACTFYITVFMKVI